MDGVTTDNQVTLPERIADLVESLPRSLSMDDFLAHVAERLNDVPGIRVAAGLRLVANDVVRLPAFAPPGSLPLEEVAHRLSSDADFGPLTALHDRVFLLPFQYGADRCALLIDVESSIDREQLRCSWRILFHLCRRAVERFLDAESKANDLWLSQAVINSLPAHIAILDQSGRVIAVNEAWERFASENGAIEHPPGPGWNYLELAQADDYSRRTLKGLADVLEGRLDRFDMEYPCHSETEERWFLMTVTKLKRPEGGVVVSHLLITDLFRARKKIERLNEELEERVMSRTADLYRTRDELRHARDAAQAASEAKGQFVANLSHELRSPLNAILGLSQLLQQEDQIGKDSLELAESIEEAGYALLALVNDALDLDVIESGRFSFREAAADLRKIITRAVQPYRLQSASNGLDIQLELGEDLAEAYIVDERRFAQIVTNLLGNAMKFTEAGEVRVCLKRIQAEPKRDLLELIVADSGPGIPAEKRERIFTRFERGQASDRHPGSGLGLAIVQGIVDRMKGKIVVMSPSPLLGSAGAPGAEFRVTVSLPRTETGPDQKPDTSSLSNPADARFNKSYSILIADDSSVSRLYLERVLVRLGLQVESASDGEAALALAVKGKFDAILLDVNMPHLDGTEAARRMRSQGVQTPIIAVSAGVTEEDVDRSLQAGMDMHLSKPLHWTDLFFALKRLLGEAN